MKRLLTVCAFALVNVACGETDECRKLAALVETNTAKLEKVKRRAKIHEKVKARTEKAEKLAQDFMDSIGLDDSESDVEKPLKERVAKIPGATIQRDAADADAAGDGTLRKKGTYWRINYRAENFDAGIAVAEKLVTAPPLYLLDNLRKKAGSDEWSLTLFRATIDRVPLKTQPVAVDPLPKADGIKSEFGFCGASTSRSALAKIESEYAAAKQKAEEVSQLLPLGASWQGIMMRSQRLNLVEEENRRLMTAFIKAVRDAKPDEFVGIGYEEPEMVLEVKGGKAVNKALEASLAPLADRVKANEASKGFVRISIANAKMTTRGGDSINPRERPRPPGHGGHGGHGHGHEHGGDHGHGDDHKH